MAILARLIAVATLGSIFSVSAPLGGNAAMGLRCSDWLNARAWMRYDPATNQYVAANPENARPVPKDVDEKSSLVIFYVSGIVETYFWLDPFLKRMADIPGLRFPPLPTLPVFLDRVAQSCQSGLQKELRDYDVLDLVSIENKEDATLRAALIQELLEKFTEAGRQGATRR
jgi:hypothetical protein